MNKVIVAFASAALLAPAVASAHQGGHWIGPSTVTVVKKSEYHERKARHHYRKAGEHARRAHRHAHRSGAMEVTYGQVLSVQPVYAGQGHSEYSCVQWSESYDRHHTAWAPTLVGGVLGGALGYHLGEDHDKPELGTLAGGLLGAAAGHSVGRRAYDSRHIQVSGPCRPQLDDHPRREPVEYQVIYRYNDRIYRERMDYDPGEWVRLNVEASPA